MRFKLHFSLLSYAGMWFQFSQFLILPPIILSELVLPFQNTGRASGLRLRKEKRTRCRDSLPVVGDRALAATYGEREQLGHS